MTAPPVWLPAEQTIEAAAQGSLQVCSTMIFPLTIVPGVGDVIGTLGEWLCVVPAAMAVDYVGTFHSDRPTSFWQPALALVVRQGWQTVVDVPIVAATIVAFVFATAGGTLIAGRDLPVTVAVGGILGATATAYVGLTMLADGVGDALFRSVYYPLAPPAHGRALEEARARAVVKPGLGGVQGGFGLLATVAAAKPDFDTSWLVPVAGVWWRAEARAAMIRKHVRRYAHDALHDTSRDLSGVDAVSGVLAATTGVANAVGEVAIAAGLGCVAAGIVVFHADPQHSHTATADALGTAGIAAVAVGAAAVVVGAAVDRLQPVLVPVAWSVAGPASAPVHQLRP